MIKKILCTLLMLISIPVFAGEFEEASISNARIFLYMYTPECGYCKQFEQTYEKLKQKYGRDCKFLKINAATKYGTDLMLQFRASYVPHIILLNNQKRTMQRVTPNCSLNFACIKDAVDKFVN